MYLQAYIRTAQHIAYLDHHVPRHPRHNRDCPRRQRREQPDRHDHHRIDDPPHHHCLSGHLAHTATQVRLVLIPSPSCCRSSPNQRPSRQGVIPEKAPCPDSPHSHIHTFPEEPTSVDLHPDAVQIRQFTPSQPLMAIIPILRNSDTQTRRAEEGPISPRSSIESRVPMDSPGMKGQWDAELGLGEKGAERGGWVKV